MDNAQQRYNTSAKGRAARKRYRQSPKGKAAARRYYLKKRAEWVCFKAQTQQEQAQEIQDNQGKTVAIRLKDGTIQAL